MHPRWRFAVEAPAISRKESCRHFTVGRTSGLVPASHARALSAVVSHSLVGGRHGDSPSRQPSGACWGNRSPAGSASRAPFGICGWLATGYYFARSMGASRNRYPPPGVDWNLVTSSFGAYAAASGSLRARRPPAADRTLGNSVGAIEWSVGVHCVLRGVPCRLGCLRASSAVCNKHSGTLRGANSVGWSSDLPRFRVVTWLILPVVICLSQRLSHACLSISNYTVKLRMAH